MIKIYNTLTKQKEEFNFQHPKKSFEEKRHILLILR